MRCSRSDRVKGWWGDAGRLERSTSLLFFSLLLSSSLQSAPDRRSLIGNEPWSRSLSWDQQIATTYRSWRGNSYPSHLYLSAAPSVSPFTPLFKCLWEVLWFIWGGVGVRATETSGSILPLLMCQTHHLLCSSTVCPDIPGLNNPPGVAMFTLLHRHCRLTSY